MRGPALAHRSERSEPERKFEEYLHVELYVPVLTLELLTAGHERVLHSRHVFRSAREDPRDLERVVPKALFLIEPKITVRGSVTVCAIIEPPSQSQECLRLPSPRAAVAARRAVVHDFAAALGILGESAGHARA